MHMSYIFEFWKTFGAFADDIISLNMEHAKHKLHKIQLL